MKKKVAFLIGTLSTGGAERVVSNLSLNMDEKIDTEILLFGSNAQIDYPYDGKLTYLDKINHKKNSFTKIYALYSRINKLKSLKKDKTVTLISFLEYPNVLNLLSKRYGKTIISVRNHMSTKHRSGLKGIFWRSTIRYLYNRADIIVSVSNEIKRDLVENYKIEEDKVKVIYNSYDIEMIQAKAKEPLEPKWEEVFNKPVIITAGRLDMQKGQWHLLRTFKKIYEQNPEVQLVILGRGQIENELMELTEQLSLQDNVHFLGFQKNPFKYISKSSFFVLPSLFEGFPNALSEAMACEVPVIATDCLSGPREILAPDDEGKTSDEISYKYNTDRFGLLVPVFKQTLFNAEDPLSVEEKVLLENMELLLKSTDLRNELAFKAIERIKEFDLKHFVKKWEEIL